MYSAMWCKVENFELYWAIAGALHWQVRQNCPCKVTLHQNKKTVEIFQQNQFSFLFLLFATLSTTGSPLLPHEKHLENGGVYFCLVVSEN